MDPPPPPPPPHGENPKTTRMPDGKYDIFILPPHSAGGGFIYLPSLKPNANSFAAGFASALLLVLVGSALKPAVMAWWHSVKGAGGTGMIMLLIAVGVGAWALGRIQTDGGPGPGGGSNAGGPSPNNGPYQNAHSNSQSNGYAGGPHPGTGPMPGAGAGPGAGPGPGPMPGAGPTPGGPKPSSWQGSPPDPTGASTAGGPGANTNTNSSAGAGGAARSAWEKAREETRRKEEERKTREAEKKRKEELEKRLREAREKEAREREAREAKKREEEARIAKQKAEEAKRKADEARWQAEEAKRKLDDELREAKRKAEDAQDQERKRKEEEALEKKRKDLEILEKRLKEARERDARERAAREKAAEDKKKKDDEEANKPRGSTYAFSAVGEKTNPWPKGRPVTPPPRSNPPSPTKRPPPAAAKTHTNTEANPHSYRPYDKPQKPMQHKKSLSSLYSESSYAASHSTSRTTPPPSHRGPYSTKDANKIVIKAVYAFNNAFLRTPTSQLVSGVGPVTDGLILRITTEGLFIDDDVRGVPQREWDVKAWTMKLVEVWCPSFRQSSAGNSARLASHAPPKQNPVRRLWGLDKEKPASAEETDALLVEMLSLCKNNCRSRANSSASSAYSASSYDSRSSASDSAYGSSVGSSSPSGANNRGANQTGEMKTARLHVLRASIRDQEGKKYVFIVSEEESWKVAIGLQRLRKGSQVRALGVSGMSAGDARSTLENLGWGI
ncbi:unnamed protein product [Diplocarpon coronariae]|uniref:Uncharacterized protein n=1 Tax=Diplocarpon coronariae TaxID=2795749 RepID=A0A218Z7V0_9HELO|nr:hypothetical protein B2J93_7353 [Marssonina coronariae]